MDEWMQLSGGEASYRQQEQRALRQVSRVQERTARGWRFRVTLASLLSTLAARVDPASAAPTRGHSETLAKAQG
jgi:hypothetical protein